RRAPEAAPRGRCPDEGAAAGRRACDACLGSIADEHGRQARMKIAYVIDSLALSGAQKHLVQLVQGMRTRGHEAVVYCLNDKVHPTRRAGLIAADARVRVIGKARVACGAAVVTCLQARNVNFQGWRKALLRVTAGLNSYTISNSRAAIAFAAEHEGADPARCYYVPNAIQVPAGLLPAPDWGSCGWPELVGQRVIGSVGRLVSQKGYDILLAAFARLAASHGDVSLLVVGSGPAAALNAEAKVLGLNGRVVFAGERADVPALLPGLTLYVQPSRFEGMPNALMEAMAAGLPVVASAVDGITELINDGVDGWLVPPGDAATLAAVLTRI